MRIFDKTTRNKIRRGIKYPVLFCLIMLNIYLLRLWPRKWILVVFGKLGVLAFMMVKKERKKTIANLTIAFGSTKTPDQIRRMARQVFVHLSLLMADYIYSLNYKTPEQFSKLVDFEGLEYLDRAYRQGRGVICLMTHLGAWEFSAIMPSVLGYETTAVSRKMPNPLIDKLIVGYRQKRGMKNIGRGGAYKKLIASLAKGECMIIMIDQDTRAKGVFVDFFGRPAYTPTGAASLALDTKSPVLPMYMVRTPDMRYRFKVLPPIELIDTGDRENDLLENTRLYTGFYKKIIKEHPEQWVWMHERWKTTAEDIQVE